VTLETFATFTLVTVVLALVVAVVGGVTLEAAAALTDVAGILEGVR
jgi:hypothetical protein